MTHSTTQNKWYHGTDSKKFNEWAIPPPICRDNTITHTGVFFTTNKAAAKAYGSNLCQTRIINNSAFFDANSSLLEMEELRLELLKTEMGAKCIYTESSYKWEMAWKQSLALGFYLSSCALLNAELYGEETDKTIAVQKQREWAENICSTLKKNGLWRLLY